MKYKLAILTHDDSLWAFSMWKEAVPLLSKRHDLVISGLWVCEEKLVNIDKKRIKSWYLATFGVWNFLLLGAFFVLFKIKTLIFSWIFNSPYSFADLAENFSIPYFYINDPNDGKFATWISKNSVDILVITMGHVLKEPLLFAPKIGIVNKHAGLLPANRGVFPYFWAKIKGQKQGVSFHRVIKKIDSGEILYQEVAPRNYTRSMITFYYWVNKEFGGMLQRALENLVDNKKPHLYGAGPSSYFSLPKKEDYLIFSQRGGSIISLSDIWLSWKL